MNLIRRLNMNEINRHEFYKQIIIDSYHLSKKEMKERYHIINYDSDFFTGFKSYAIKINNTIIFTTVGTNSIQDLISDKKLLSGKIPSHVKKLKNFIESTLMNPAFQNYKIVLNGHSLGGSANTILSTKYITVSEVVNFNPFGTRNIIGENNIKSPTTPLNRITNYCNLNDDISTYKLSNQVGNCYTLYTENKHNAHFIDNVAPLSTRKQFNQYDKTLETRIRQRLEILNKIENKAKHIKDTTIKKIKNVFQISTESDFNQCLGSYPVSGYTRNDGTKVEGYTRTCYKHSGMSQAERLTGQAKFKGKKFQDLSPEELQEAISYFI